MADRWEQAEAAAQLAVELACAVRDDDPADVHRRLRSMRRHQPLLLEQVVVALAAMVPDDAAPSELLAWTDELAGPAVPRPPCDPRLDGSPPRARSEHGTRSRYVAGCRGAGCSQAQSEYDACRPRRPRLTVVPSDERTG